MIRPSPSAPWLRLALALPVLLLAGGRIAGIEPLRRFEDRIYDTVLVPLLPAPAMSDRIAIIEVDDRTLSELGERWPLDRRTWATFFRRLASFEPEAVAADVLFAQPSQEDVRVLADDVRKRIAAAPNASGESATALLTILDAAVRALDADQQLAEALTVVGDVTLGVIIASGPTFPTSATPFEPLVRGVGPLALEADGVVVSTPRLFLSARSHGAMNVLMDADGVVRRYPYMIGLHGDGYPSLALAMRLSDLGQEAQAPIVARVLAADSAAPYLRFREVEDGRTPWPRVSLSDVLFSGEGSKAIGDLLRGRFVFVGATAPGIQDLLRTPVAWGRAGIEVHATALENLLLGSWIQRGGVAGWLSLALTLILVGGFAIFLSVVPRARAMAGYALAAILTELGLALALADAGLLVGLLPVPLGLALLAIGEGVHRWFWGRQEQERLAAREGLMEAERAGLERLRAVVEHVGDAIVSVDAAQRIRWMNPAAESLFRRRARTAVNRPVSELVPTFDAQQASGEVLAGEARVGAELIPVEATATRMSVGGEGYTNFVFRDVAARKAMERQKDEFIAGINHELRTPLTSILGSLKLVAGGAVGALPDKAKELLEIAEKNGELLLSLVSDLLDTAKIDAGRLVLQTRPIALNALLAEATERQGGFGSRYEVAIELAALPVELEHASVDVDKERVIQVVGNLVSNAVKHSPRGGCVCLTATPSAKLGHVRISVIDEGPGIPPEFRDQVFERFTMTVAGDGQRRPGTGLGLAIARGIVEAHRGEMGFATDPAHGTTFWFELPCLS